MLWWNRVGGMVGFPCPSISQEGFLTYFLLWSLGSWCAFKRKKNGFLPLSAKQIHGISGGCWGCFAGSPWPARGEEILSNTNILFSVQFPHLWFVGFTWMDIEISTRKFLACAMSIPVTQDRGKARRNVKCLQQSRLHMGKQRGF